MKTRIRKVALNGMWYVYSGKHRWMFSSQDEALRAAVYGPLPIQHATTEDKPTIHVVGGTQEPLEWARLGQDRARVR